VDCDLRRFCIIYELDREDRIIRVFAIRRKRGVYEEWAERLRHAAESKENDGARRKSCCVEGLSKILRSPFDKLKTNGGGFESVRVPVIRSMSKHANDFFSSFVEVRPWSFADL
jgi:hypothetical protein